MLEFLAPFVTKIQLAAMSRSDIANIEDRRPFYLYVDEFQNFATDSFATILSEARKYGLNLTVANQYISQMEENVRNAVFGNVGTTISFRVSADDAPTLSKQFEANSSQATSCKCTTAASSLIWSLKERRHPPLAQQRSLSHHLRLIISMILSKNSRRLYARDRADIEHEINERIMPSNASKPVPKPVVVDAVPAMQHAPMVKEEKGVVSRPLLQSPPIQTCSP